MKDSSKENPKNKRFAVLRTAILGAVIYGGINLAFFWSPSYKNYDFGSVSLVGLILAIPPFFVSDFIDFVSKFFGFARFADAVTETQTFCVIINALFGALIGYWVGCETRNRQRP